MGAGPAGVARILYSLAWWLATPLVLASLLWRSRRQPAYRAHLAERFGRYRAPAPAPRRMIWLHAVSVGETRAAQPLVEALLARLGSEAAPIEVLLTHMTPTGLETAHALFGDRVRHALLPYDYPGAMRRFLAHWRPCLGVLLETELWPNLTHAARRQGIPLVLANARLSAVSLRKGLRWRWLIEPALARLAGVLAQTDVDARRLAELGRRDVVVTGNLKFDVVPDAASQAMGRQWRQCSGVRPVVVFASSRDGEEALFLAAWRQATAGALLVIVPRHPQRFDEIARLIEASGLRWSRRSAVAAGQMPDWAAIDVLLGDSMGEMSAYYTMADAAVIGGSLLPFGGQNLIEPCALGVPVVVGPNTYNFEAAANAAVSAGAAIRVPDAQAAVQSALALVSDAQARGHASQDALAFANAHRGATRRTLEALLGFADA
ncbi:MAG: lipid IV(A) 3-deoxy-D-manno-octulosonic acid transferase [Burkholderiaceae bacterium]|nr:lipid IV(A) 3-deoxy-D-manno-octulosonic acid transferase [Burkholderiaceae bacterium]